MANLAERRKEMLDAMAREAIYEAAVGVLTEHGLAGLTMDRVAAAAGTAKGSLYNHFQNKRELLQLVHNRAVGPMEEALRNTVEADARASDKLATISKLWREYLNEHRALFEFLINDHSVKALLQDTEQTSRALAIQLIGLILEQGVRSGEFRELDTQLAAEAFVGASIGLVEQEFARGEPRRVQAAVDSLIDVFLHGLSATGSAGGGATAEAVSD